PGPGERPAQGRPVPHTHPPGPAAYLREPGRPRVLSSRAGVWPAPPPRGGRGNGRRSQSACPQPRGRGPGKAPHRRTSAPRPRAQAPKPGQLRQRSLPASRSLASDSRHLRWRPQRPRRRHSRAAPASEPCCARRSSSRPAAPPAPRSAPALAPGGRRQVRLARRSTALA
uniref:Uncharacterized protein n=1 Tax=Castor canadensis TaxID=51338 RepID=A0A8C0WKG6_CASCN